MNVAESNADSKASTSNLLCDNSFADASNLPSTSELKTDSSVSSTADVVGWSTENVMIYAGVTSSEKDALTAYSDKMDFCLTYS